MLSSGELWVFFRAHQALLLTLLGVCCSVSAMSPSRAGSILDRNDPTSVLLHCSEKFESAPRTGQCFTNEVEAGSAPGWYGNALYALWSNREDALQAAIKNLRYESFDPMWLWAAEAEVLAYRKALTSLHRQLLHTKAPHSSSTWRALFDRFRLSLMLSSGEREQLQEMLKKRGRAAVLKHLDLAIVQVHLLANQSRTRELGKLLVELKRQHPNDEFVTIAGARLALDTEGIAAALKILETNFPRFEESPGFLLEYGFLLLQEGSAIRRERGEGLVRRAVEQSKYRADFALSTTLLLLHYRHTALAWEIYRHLESVPGWKSVEEKFTDFHTVRAWQMVHLGNLDGATQSLAKALEEAPRDPEANWLRYLICKRTGAAECIAESLDNLWHMTPLDGYVRKAILAESMRFPDERKLQKLDRDVTAGSRK